jgi:hypothetical protein
MQGTIILIYRRLVMDIMFVGISIVLFPASGLFVMLVDRV